METHQESHIIVLRTLCPVLFFQSNSSLTSLFFVVKNLVQSPEAERKEARRPKAGIQESSVLPQAGVQSPVLTKAGVQSPGLPKAGLQSSNLPPSLPEALCQDSIHLQVEYCKKYFKRCDLCSLNRKLDPGEDYRSQR
jgi:hypothetical protein